MMFPPSLSEQVKVRAFRAAPPGAYKPEERYLGLGPAISGDKVNARNGAVAGGTVENGGAVINELANPRKPKEDEAGF
jgi:hypothetical protein